MAKAKPKGKIVSVAADPAPSTNKMIFGIVVEINEKQVPISTDDLSDLKKNGLHFTLPEPVTLGSFTDLSDWLDKNFGVSIPDGTDLPDPLDKLVGAIKTLEFKVEQLAIKIPGTDNKTEKRTYQLRLSGAWNEAHDIIPGLDVLQIKGGIFGVTNMVNDQTPDEPTIVVQ